MRKPRGPDNPQRAHRRAMEHLWRQDPWVPGFTCILSDEVHHVYLRWLEGHRIHLDWLAPALANWLMWQFVGLVRRRQLDAREADEVIAILRKRDDAMAGPPAGGSDLDMTAESNSFAWRPRLYLRAEWVHPRADARRHMVVVAPQRAGVRLARPWQPPVGSARLTTCERLALAGAAERDFLLGSGEREVRAARKEVVEARRARMHNRPHAEKDTPD